MVKINVYSAIDKEDIFMSMFGFEDTIFFADPNACALIYEVRTFISKFNSYDTNKKNKNMSQEPAKPSLQNWRNKTATVLKNAANFLAEMVNCNFIDEEGNVLFSTKNEDDTLEVGMSASPDGTFELPDGRTVIIVDGAITEIQEVGNETENLRAENEALKSQVSELTNCLQEGFELVKDLRNQIGSNYNVSPRNRVVPGTKPSGARLTKEEQKEQMRNNLKKNQERKINMASIIDFSFEKMNI